jgi:hypothetical protein
MKKFFTLLLLAAASLNFSAAHAHGSTKPQHGGIVEMSNELVFELVARGDGAELYIDDHGQTVPTAKVTGKLSVLSGGAKSEARLEPAAGEKLVAKGVKLAKGDKVIALVTTEDKKTTSVRFVIK